MGPKAVLVPLAYYFLNLLESIGLLDIHPNSLKANNISGEGRISMRLDIFTIASQLVDKLNSVRQWIGSGGDSNRCPIFLEVKDLGKKPLSPFKFNLCWINEEYCMKILK